MKDNNQEAAVNVQTRALSKDVYDKARALAVQAFHEAVTRPAAEAQGRGPVKFADHEDRAELHQKVSGIYRAAGVAVSVAYLTLKDTAALEE